MNKRFQVFVSSTYADLREERSRVIQTLMEMDCIPSGMELFPAADEDQFEFIKKVIDDCDYYLLIIGGRYGSTTAEGVSYTEKEYEYAITKGLKVIALLHQEPDSIPVGKTDKDAELSKRLEEFREKVQQGRLVKYWRTAEELPGIVSLSLSKTIKTYPSAGWVRGNAAASTEVLEEINELRKKNADLQAALSSVAMQPSQTIQNIAGLDVIFGLSGTYQMRYDGQYFDWSSKLTFGQMFALIGPHLIEHPSDRLVRIELAKSILGLQGKKPYDTKIEDQAFQTFKIQLQALGLIDLRYTSTVKGGMALFWSLTNKGTQTMVQLRAVRKDG
ncbi:hypothetical protein C1O66_12175 [Paucibacter aquatile]|uniref:DUF4062 domain-containing protein n=1 Tax=Kinneretia aquatilis TaxID=2070761 RepID=A0A2N8KXT0_9BURK|nr:DUF4062 domain-containing protein [Paucibacter aquatile]PND38202.1 hypothetical protein C1O66_12175 [Paucibacter aquatile]